MQAQGIDETTYVRDTCEAIAKQPEGVHAKLVAEQNRAEAMCR